MLKIKIFILFFWFCSFKDNKIKHKFNIALFKNTSIDQFQQIATIEEDDIICIDWPHQSFKIKDNIVNQINKDKMIGVDLEYFSLMYDSKEYARFGIYRSSSSNQLDFSLYPRTFYRDSLKSIFIDNWLIINYIKLKINNRGGYFSSLFNNNAFEYLNGKGKLKAQDWRSDSTKSNIENKPDLDYYINLTKRFKQ